MGFPFGDATPVGEPERWEELARRVRDGDRAAADALAETLFAPLANFARRALGDPGASDDVAQETIVRVVKSIHRYQPGTRFRAWVYRIALNLCRNAATRHRHTTSEGLPEEAFVPLPRRPVPLGPEDEAAGRDDAVMVRAALARLAPPYREIVNLRLYQGLSFQEISDALDVPEGTLKSRMHHAIRHLRGLLGVEAPAPRLATGATPDVVVEAP